MVAITTVRPPRSNSRPQVEIEEQRDFAGGLNLKDDPYNLGDNESFDLQNVDIDRRGGFGVRRGSREFDTGPVTLDPTTPDSGYTYVDTTDVLHILIARAGNVKTSDGALGWDDVITGIVSSGRTQFVEYRNVLYILPPGQIPAYTWSGSGAATQLTTAVGNYNDDLTNPNNGNIPPARCLAVHKEVMWAGGVVDTGAVTHNSRLRWSHPGAAQDWRTNDFIDIDPDDENGYIRALVPFGDRLLVFKDRAIYAVHGDPPAGFSVQNLTKELGTPSQWSVVATEGFIYFWDSDTGAWRYNGKSFEWLFEPIYRLIDDEKINVQFSFQTIVEYHRDRLWCSVPMLAPPYEDSFVALVYQPSAGKEGAWTIHDKTLFGWWVHRGSTEGADEHLLGGNGDFLYELDVENFYEDQQLQRGLDLDGVDDRATTPDDAQHDITTDLDVYVQIMRDDLTTFDDDGEILASKWLVSAGGRSWAFVIADGGFLGFAWSPDGGTDERAVLSTIPVTDAMRHPTHTSIYLRATMDVDDGGDHTITFYTTPGEAPWSQLGDPVTLSGTTTVFNGGADLAVGGRATAASGTFPPIGTFSSFTGLILRFVLMDGIAGTEIANPQFYEAAWGDTSLVDDSGLTWTLDTGGGGVGYFEYFTFIEAWYTTRWFDANVSAQKKRWLRPVVVMRADSTQRTIVDVFRDYDPTRVFKTFELITTLDGETGVWDDSDWDNAQWAAEVTLGGEKSIALRGAPLSGGVARALKFKNTVQGQDWRIHGLTMKWKPKRIRN